MATELIMVYKKGKVYRAVYIAGNGKAWNNWYMLYKKANNDEEALKWAENVIISRKWGEKYKIKSIKWMKDLFNLKDEDIISPYMAGMDYGYYDKKGNFFIDGGFEIYLTCEKPDKCKLIYNSGTRNYPEYKEVYLPKPKYKKSISFGAGRSNKETIYLSHIPKNVIYHKFNKI